MNTTLQSRITQFWQHIQISLFPFLEEIELVLTPKLQELVTALEMMKVERFLDVYQFGAIGRACDIGTKLDSKGHKTSWQGYKLHVDTADGDIPVSCILSSATA